MYILRNALKNLARNKGRNILVGLVLIAIIAAAVVGLVINNTASAVINDYRARFGSRVSITPDMDALRARHGVPPGGFITAAVIIPSEQVLAFAQSQYLMGYVMTVMKTGGTIDLSAVGEVSLPTAAFNLGPDGEIAAIDPNAELSVDPQFRVMGNVWDEFETGERFLLEGKMPQADGEALIGQELAKLNGLTIGNEITVTSSHIFPDGGSMHVSTTLTISGIFLDLTEDIDENQLLGGFLNPHFSRRNEILTTADTLINSIAQHDDLRAFMAVILNPIYYLRNPVYLPYFEMELREKGLDYIYIVSTDEAAFNTIVEPVEGLRSILFTFVIVVLGLGAVILILLSTIAIRERKYEIGVLRAMGMKKSKVARGLLYEMGALTVICLTLGIIAGTAAAQPVADNLLLQQVEIVERTTQIEAQTVGMEGALEAMARDFMGPLNPPEAEPLSEISVRLSAPAMLQIAAVAILLAFVASVIGLVNIMRYEPIKILMERD
ncbi:MAG: FtsX-like permease family protein [Oscillospiraceae bacterium]|nr:FtsX-like permease family protein [Oscillospiraceae bacterium]